MEANVICAKPCALAGKAHPLSAIVTIPAGVQVSARPALQAGRGIAPVQRT